MTAPAGGLPRTEAVLERQRAAGLHPGACLVATLDAEPAGVAAVGEARPGVPMGPDTVVPWFSLTKVATALRAAMAWEAGALTLDDPVALHLPAFAAAGKADVTVRHLLTHTAGFRGADAGPTLDAWDDELARICAEPQEEGWRPGRDAGYSLRAGFFVLAEVVRRALGDGRPWERMVGDDVLAPLGMVDSHLAVDPATAAALAPRTATYWATPPAATPAHPLEDQPPGCVPASSGRGPVEELPRLLEVLYHGGGGLLSPAAAEAVTARHRTGLTDRTFGAVIDWGLGVIVDSKVHGRPL
ncbi:MAG: serine hydrolase domain-containing protein, partial [Acidimicrobiales bacterium]